MEEEQVLALCDRIRAISMALRGYLRFGTSMLEIRKFRI
jgi:hypothetical protein